MNKQKILESGKGYVFMLLACIAYGLSTSLFLVPNAIIAGGVAGLSVLIHIIDERIPVGMISIVINLPILIMGTKLYGLKFIGKCLLTITCFCL